jgi:hypothetical protein
LDDIYFLLSRISGLVRGIPRSGFARMGGGTEKIRKHRTTIGSPYRNQPSFHSGRPDGIGFPRRFGVRFFRIEYFQFKYRMEICITYEENVEGNEIHRGASCRDSEDAFGSLFFDGDQVK